MTNEEILANYMQRYYTDERLAALLAHTEDEKLSFHSCSCFIGITTAAHALLSEGELCPEGNTHVNLARGLDGSDGDIAESAFLELAWTDEIRRMKLLPLIYAEVERRDRSRLSSEELVVIEQGEVVQITPNERSQHLE